ncbi:MAG: ribbon-helix-helix protein, CopG family [Burkholderiales bacterium]|nr:MAG: ribbon-helix-helix protein, CopG family [Burkholderiales bacterium]
MPTTTIRLDDDLKERVSEAAARVGKTAHAFIRDAITASVAQAEFDAEMDRICEERWGEFLKTGEVVPWEDAKGYLEATVAGKKAKRPVPRKILG